MSDSQMSSSDLEEETLHSPLGITITDYIRKTANTFLWYQLIRVSYGSDRNICYVRIRRSVRGREHVQVLQNAVIAEWNPEKCFKKIESDDTVWN